MRRKPKRTRQPAFPVVPLTAEQKKELRDMALAIAKLERDLQGMLEDIIEPMREGIQRLRLELVNRACRTQGLIEHPDVLAAQDDPFVKLNPVTNLAAHMAAHPDLPWLVRDAKFMDSYWRPILGE